MSTSNVRSIDALDEFRGGLLKLADGWERSTQEIRLIVQRVQTHFCQDLPQYWRRQIQLAERALTEAKDRLSMKQSAARASDRVAATEEKQQVHRCERRLGECQQKERLSRSLAIQVTQQCDKLLGPLSDISEHCESHLPTAATELAALVMHLRNYTQQSDPSAGA